VGDGKEVAVTTTVSGGEVTMTVTTSGVQATSNKASAAKMGKG
jgi:hypothetical protein